MVDFAKQKECEEKNKICVCHLYAQKITATAQELAGGASPEKK